MQDNELFTVLMDEVIVAKENLPKEELINKQFKTWLINNFDSGTHPGAFSYEHGLRKVTKKIAELGVKTMEQNLENKWLKITWKDKTNSFLTIQNNTFLLVY